MQPSRGRSDRAVRTRVDRLVAGPVLLGRLACDVRRERDLPCALEQSTHGARRLEPDPELSLAEGMEHRGPASLQLHHGARADSLARLSEADPAQRVGGARQRPRRVHVRVWTHQKQLDPSAAPLLPAEEPCGDDAGVVQDHDVSAPEEPGPVQEPPVGDRPRGSDPARAAARHRARRGGPLR